MGLQETIDGLKSDIERIGVDGVLVAATPQAPWLNYPVINYVARYIVGKILSIAINKTELGAFIMFTVYEKDKQANDYKSAAKQLEAGETKGLSSEEIKKLQQAKIDAARALIKFTPSR